MVHRTVFAVRGAITVPQNTEEDILSSTTELLDQMLKKNNLNEGNIVSIFFTATEDLTACFPAKAARELGLTDTPLMCAKELEISGALTHCVRIMIHYQTNDHTHKPVHVYLKEAKTLRPDLHST